MASRLYPVPAARSFLLAAEPRTTGHLNLKAQPMNFLDHLSETFGDDQPEVIQQDNDPDLQIVGPEAFQACHQLRHPLCLNAGRIPPYEPYGYSPPLNLTPGYDVELDDNEFVRISSTWEDDEQGILVQGRLFVPRSQLGLGSDQEMHELVEIFRTGNDLNREQNEFVFHARRIRGNCQIILTNQRYQDLNYATVYAPEGYMRRLFFCRCASMEMDIRNDPRIRATCPRMGRVDFLRARDADKMMISTQYGQTRASRISDHKSRSKWRGQENTKLRGSYVDNINGIQEYTMGDAFCGAGGTSFGALAAGLKLKWSFDFNESAINTYRRVFQQIYPTGTNAEWDDVFQWVQKAALSDDYSVDFLHLSPPCQPFAGINTHPSEETNRPKLEAFLQVGRILHAARPRVVTVEETEGLTHAQHRQYFVHLVRVFVDAGFNVQWKKLSLNHYGVPQKRDRLIFIATAPGERVPPFPKRTHASDPSNASPEEAAFMDLLPHPTIWNAINQVRRTDQDHNLYIRESGRAGQKPVDGNGVSNTILTKGNSDIVHHPDGRNYTIRELAVLQTFPRWFEFQGGVGEKHTQIGNAVPPLFAKTLFTELKGWMAQCDDEELRARANAGR